LEKGSLNYEHSWIWNYISRNVKVVGCDVMGNVIFVVMFVSHLTILFRLRISAFLSVIHNPETLGIFIALSDGVFVVPIVSFFSKLNIF